MSSENEIFDTVASAARDGNLDIEDVESAVLDARADERLAPSERRSFERLIRNYASAFEPAALRYLKDVLDGEQAEMPNRVILAPHPRGTQRDLYYARADVVALQEVISDLGFSTWVDGDYGLGTSRAVSSFQESVGLEPSGVLDSRTLVELNRVAKARGLPVLDVTPRAHIRPDYVVALKHGSNTSDNRAIEEGLCRLGEHFGLDDLRVRADGRYDEETEVAVRAFQLLAYLPETGIVDRTTVICLNDALEAVGLQPVDVDIPEHGAGFGGRVELHFYPGDRENKLYVKKDGKVLDEYGMVGGLATGKKDPNNPKVDYSPSPRGRYEVVEVNPHASGAWAYSYVPYGSHLREQGGEIQFRDSRGKWKYVTGPQGAFKGRTPAPLAREAYFDGEGNVMSMWRLNDFGHLRGRLKSLSTGALQGHMIHSSPDQEQTLNYFVETEQFLDPELALRVLRHSHGCEHIHPRDMDELIAKGYLTRGTRFVVHGYDEMHG